jgi:hypothetical protein
VTWILTEGSAAEGIHWNSCKAVSVLSLAVALVLTTGCGRQTAGNARAPDEVQQENWVEWVTDPESNSAEPIFLSVVLRGDGDFTVGADFPSGTYESPGPRGERACTWSRLVSEPDGSLQVLQSGGGPGVQQVNITRSDLLFRSSACQPWVKAP